MYVLIRDCYSNVDPNTSQKPSCYFDSNMDSVCMNVSVEGEQQLEVASDFLYPSK